MNPIRNSQASHSCRDKIFVFCWSHLYIYNGSNNKRESPTNKSKTRSFLLECGGKIVEACCNKFYSTVENYGYKYKTLPRRTDFKTTPLFCLSYTDVLMKQRRCFKEVPAKHQRDGGKRVDCRRLFKRDIFCYY